MWQQARLAQALAFIYQRALHHPAVIRFMVFKSEMRHVIAQAVEEVVIAIVMRAKKFLRLVHQRLVMVENILRRIQRRRAVGGDIHFSYRIIGQRHNAQELTADHRRIHQGRQRNRTKTYLTSRLRSHRQRCSKLPSCRKP